MFPNLFQVDQMLPLNVSVTEDILNSKPMGRPQEFWTAYVEKAFVKRQHGTYDAIDGGNCTLGLMALTGGICISTNIEP